MNCFIALLVSCIAYIISFNILSITETISLMLALSTGVVTYTILTFKEN